MSLVKYPSSWTDPDDTEELQKETKMMDTIKHENKQFNELFWKNFDYLQQESCGKIPKSDLYESAYEYTKDHVDIATGKMVN